MRTCRARAVRLGAAVVLAAALAGLARAQDSLEPPPEVPDGSDYEAELADTLGGDMVEVALGASGRAGGGPQRRRRLRLAGDSLEASVREERESLAGGSLESRGAGGAFGLGRMAPRWGLGLVLGSADEPWRSTPLDRGAHAPFRGRSGEGGWLRRTGAVPVEMVAGRFGKRSLAAVSLGAGGAGFGALASRTGEAQGSLFLEHPRGGAEMAFDRAGRWRAEAALERPLGAWRLTGRVRGGLESYRSLAEPSRTGPASALVTGMSWRGGAVRVRTLGALWRFAPGIGGARAMAEARIAAGEGAFVLGVEEQHGLRRVPAKPPSAPAGMRQGAWVEWRGGTEPIGLRLRHEVWGARAWARDAVRSVTAAGIEATLGYGIGVRIVHTVFHTRSGERIYLPEAESDRLVLRAVRGVGDRTRIEARVPFGRGSLNGSLALAGGANPPSTRWAVEWARRSRVRRR